MKTGVYLPTVEQTGSTYTIRRKYPGKPDKAFNLTRRELRALYRDIGNHLEVEHPEEPPFRSLDDMPIFRFVDHIIVAGAEWIQLTDMESLFLGAVVSGKGRPVSYDACAMNVWQVSDPEKWPASWRVRLKQIRASLSQKVLHIDVEIGVVPSVGYYVHPMIRVDMSNPVDP